MNNIILFDSADRIQLLPFTYLRPVCDIRTGIWTIREKWEKYFEGRYSVFTEDYLREKFPSNIESVNYLINGAILPDRPLVNAISGLTPGDCLYQGDIMIAAVLDKENTESYFSGIDISFKRRAVYSEKFNQIRNLVDINRFNAGSIISDMQLLTSGRSSAPISPTNTVIGDGALFVEEGAVIECATINTTTGPVYIGRQVEIMEGSNIRGPFAIAEGSAIKMGSKIYGPVSIGPGCKVGGELKSVVMFGNANKGHEGFLGDSVVGEWCNFGADTNNSNLKNNYDEVRLWNYASGRFDKTGEQFCGLFIGDHSKTGINTMFNTGTVVGICANIFGEGYPRNFIPSFSWGGKQGFETYPLKKAFDTIQRVFERRKSALGDIDKKILQHVFAESSKHRSWEKDYVL